MGGVHAAGESCAGEPYQSFSGWDISEYLNRWDLIEARLRS